MIMPAWPSKRVPSRRWSMKPMPRRFEPLGPLYVVSDVLPALERLGVAARARSPARIVAVTGSAGKTSTKEALRLVLAQAGASHAPVASYNNHWGVPLTLARMPKHTSFGIYEIGMNHQGEITPLSAMVRPHVAIITTIAPVHLEYFESLDDIADAKAEIFSGLVQGGVAILNRDIAEYERLLAHAKASPAGHAASFGEHEKADAKLVSVTLGADHSIVQAEVCGHRLTYRLGAPGRHLAMNSLAVLLTAKAFGVDLELAAGTLAFFSAQPGRGERLRLSAKNGPFTLIDESYNANPASVRAAIALAGALPLPGKGRRIAVLGDMLELGDKGAAMHAELAGEALANHIDLVFAAGPLMKHLFEALPGHLQGAWRDRASDLAAVVVAEVQSGDMVIVKGSNASRDERDRRRTQGKRHGGKFRAKLSRTVKCSLGFPNFQAFSGRSTYFVILPSGPAALPRRRSSSCSSSGQASSPPCA